MRRFRSLLIGGALVISACAPQTTPTPTRTPRPTATPPPFATVIVTRAPVTLPPTWTPEPTLTSPPTSTRLPTSTPLPTRTPVPSRTPIGGAFGVVSPDGQITVHVTEEEINTALAELRETVYFSTDINRPPVATLTDSGIRLSANFNDFSPTGVSADFRLGVLIMRGELTVNLLGYESSDGRSLDANNVRAALNILRAALAEYTVPAAIRRSEPFMAVYQPRFVSVSPEGVIVTAQIIDLAPPPPEDTPESESSGS
jgi:hypothetical protein